MQAILTFLPGPCIPTTTLHHPNTVKKIETRAEGTAESPWARAALKQKLKEWKLLLSVPRDWVPNGPCACPRGRGTGHSKSQSPAYLLSSPCDWCSWEGYVVPEEDRPLVLGSCRGGWGTTEDVAKGPQVLNVCHFTERQVSYCGVQMKGIVKLSETSCEVWTIKHFENRDHFMTRRCVCDYSLLVFMNKSQALPLTCLSFQTQTALGGPGHHSLLVTELWNPWY